MVSSGALFDGYSNPPPLDLGDRLKRLAGLDLASKSSVQQRAQPAPVLSGRRPGH